SLEIYRETAHAGLKAGATPARAGLKPCATPIGTTAVPVAQAFRPAETAVDVLFGQAYFLRFDPKLWEARQPYAPLGALYAAAHVRDAGYRVALFDAMLAASELEW